MEVSKDKKEEKKSQGQTAGAGEEAISENHTDDENDENLMSEDLQCRLYEKDFPDEGDLVIVSGWKYQCMFGIAEYAYHSLFVTAILLT